jgi:L1 cell adhesion molecule like protein
VLEIPPARAGVPQIEISFQIDDDGILHVFTSEKFSGVNKTVKITSDKGRLSKEEIERMIKEAEKYKDEDKKYRIKVEARNALEKYAYNISNAINDKEISSKLSSEDKKVINGAIDSVLMWLDVNVVAEQHDFEYYRTTLSNVFDPIIIKMINDEGNSMQLGTVVGYAVDKKKNRWTSIFAKYAFQIGFSAATNTFVNTAASVIVEIFKNM